MEHSSEFSAVWNKASGLISGHLNLDGQELPAPGFFERRRLKKALSLFEAAGRMEADNPAPLLFASKIQERLGNSTSSLEWVRKAHALEPDNLILIIELGAALGRCGMHSEAVPVLVKGIEQHPTDPRVHANLGLELLMAGTPQKAVSAFQRLLDLEPQGQQNKRLLALAEDVAAGRKPVPKTEQEVVRLM
jgi:tetratricopeptide (TPR) repeat protein